LKTKIKKLSNYNKMMEIHLQIIGFKCLGALSNSHDERSFGSIQNVGDNILVPSLLLSKPTINP
jgi:hypothetical protein